MADAIYHEEDSCCACLVAIDESNRYFFHPCLHHILCRNCREVLPDNACPVCRAADREHDYSGFPISRDAFAKSCHTGNVYQVKTMLKYHLLGEQEPALSGPDTDLHLLFDACWAGHSGLVQLFLDLGISPDLSPRGVPPLYIACERNHLEVVKMLHKAGAEMDQITTGCCCDVRPDGGRFQDKEIYHTPSCEKEGYSALYVACECGWLEIIRYLLDEAGVDPTVLRGVSSPLHAALECDGGLSRFNDQAVSTGEVLSLLLSRGMAINQKDSVGRTALISACRRDGNLATVKYLLEAGADVSTLENLLEDHHGDNERRSALYYACQQGYVEIVELLLNSEFVDVNQPCSELGYYPLHVAARSDNGFNVTTLLLEHGADPNLVGGQYQDTPFSAACEEGNLEVARCYLERNAQVGVQDKDGNTPFMIAISLGRLNIVKHLWHLRDYQNLGCHLPDNHGKTPLMEAAEHPEVLEFLLQHGFDTDRADDKGNTVFHHCASYSESLQLLLGEERSRSHFNRPNLKGTTPLMEACQLGKLESVKVLLEESPANEDVGTLEAVLKCRNQTGYTPLHLSVDKEHLDIVQYLMSKKDGLAGINIANKHNWTPLHTACHGKFEKIAECLLSSEYMGDIHLKTETGDTALIMVCDRGMAKLVPKMIEKYRAKKIGQRIQEINYRSRIGYSAFHAAVLRGRPEVVKYLLGVAQHIGINCCLPNLEELTPIQTARIQLEKIVGISESTGSSDTDAVRTPQSVAVAGHQEVLEVLMGAMNN